ncbi:tyrosine-type recombinase/integrase [Streptomyces antarcticus]|uniref:tyrosine-type recombinase/integrase n=1 Tax=Streptomyces antarcticus TaxID=2996458 RepID=UPI00227142FF|nr:MULTISPECIES: site-specific integrase [unclassified Streptomyces]MCY0940515.1 tyrosine-type recombinase/integrase [Streptomyces sp. H34-AA3]MCZ4082366.1 tyrosine-type recombinase/integrase [Streptomyces sp. H34-S5]
MRTTGDRGRIYRRCGCRDTLRHQLGAHCPHLLTNGDHGTWTFAVDVPAPRHRRTTVRRGGFDSHDAAKGALRRFLEGEAGGFNADPNQSVADYLTAWLAAKALVLKPTTMARYRDYVHNDLVPAFGTLKLDELGHRHIAAFVTGELAAGRGQTTLYRCLATLSSALGDAFRQHRLPRNPASPPALHRPPSPERRIWTADEAVRFLHHCHQADPDMADLFEFLIGTGLRKGEALGLHWNDVRLAERVLYVRCTLSAIDNNHLVITSPKTRSSRGWVAISPRVATALQHRSRATDLSRGDPYDRFAGLVFCGSDGRPLRPQGVLDRLRKLSAEARVPRITVHDMRHLAATITITAGVPLTVVSKTLRHSTLSTTANIYSHLTQQAAREAVDTIDHALTEAEKAGRRTDRPAWLRPPRDHLQHLREALNRLRSPAPPGFHPTANQPRSGRATTLRPPGLRTRKRPSSRG